MAPVATEVLNEDIKELKSDLRDIRSSIDVLKADTHRIDNALAKIQAEFGLAKWLLGLTLTLMISGLGWAIYTAGGVNSDVKHLASDVGEIKRMLDGAHLTYPTSIQRSGPVHHDEPPAIPKKPADDFPLPDPSPKPGP